MPKHSRGKLRVHPEVVKVRSDVARFLRHRVGVTESGESGVVSKCATRKVDGVVEMKRNHGGEKMRLRYVPLATAEEGACALNNLLAHAGLHLQE